MGEKTPHNHTGLKCTEPLPKVWTEPFRSSQLHQEEPCRLSQVIITINMNCLRRSSSTWNVFFHIITPLNNLSFCPLPFYHLRPQVPNTLHGQPTHCWLRHWDWQGGIKKRKTNLKLCHPARALLHGLLGGYDPDKVKTPIPPFCTDLTFRAQVCLPWVWWLLLHLHHGQVGVCTD